MLLALVQFNHNIEQVSTIDIDGNNSYYLNSSTFCFFNIKRILKSLHRYALHKNHKAIEVYKRDSVDYRHNKQNSLRSKMQRNDTKNK